MSDFAGFPKRGHFVFIEGTPVLFQPKPNSTLILTKYSTLTNVPNQFGPRYSLEERQCYYASRAAANMRAARRDLMRHLSGIVDRQYTEDLRKAESWSPYIVGGIFKPAPKQAYRLGVLAEFRDVMHAVEVRLEQLEYRHLFEQRLYVAEPLVDFLRNNDVIIENPLSVFDMIVTSINRIDNNDAKD